MGAHSKPEAFGISDSTLLLSVALGAATSILLATAGRVLQRRHVTPGHERAALAFALWWYAASLVILNQALRTTLALAGVEDIALYVTLAYVGNVPLAAAVGCLMHYILYLLTGRDLLRPILAVYGTYLGYLMWFTARAGERTLEVGEWQARLVGSAPPSPAASLIFGVVLAAPVVVTVASYALLAFRVREWSHRYRLVMVCAAFLFLFGTILAGFLLRWNEEPWFPLAYEIPALAASLLVLLAYRPPLWLQRRLRIQSVPVRPA